MRLFSRLPSIQALVGLVRRAEFLYETGESALNPSRSAMTDKNPDKNSDKNSEKHSDHHSDQLLHLVLGGELTSLEGVHFRDLTKLDVVGVFPNYASAYAAWRAKAQMTVDNAHMRYFIVHLHRLMEPDHPH